jgi:hypothetical protein
LSLCLLSSLRLWSILHSVTVWLLWGTADILTVSNLLLCSFISVQHLDPDENPEF